MTNVTRIQALDLACPQCRTYDSLFITPAAFGSWKQGQALLRLHPVMTCDVCDLYLEGRTAPGASWTFHVEEETADVVEPSPDSRPS